MVDYNQFALDILNSESNEKLLRNLGTDPKIFDWGRFKAWLEGLSFNKELLKKVQTPNKPSKGPVNMMLKDHAGENSVQTYVSTMYHAKWLQTKDLILDGGALEFERFVKIWQGSEYGTKYNSGFKIAEPEIQQITDHLCASVISWVDKWTLDRGPSIINNFMKVLTTVTGYKTPHQGIKGYKYELGALFLQSGFFQKDVRKYFAFLVSPNYIMVARALGIDVDDVQVLPDNAGYLIKIGPKSLEAMNSDQKLFIKIEDKFNDHPKNKNRYIIHDLSLSPQQAFMKAWKICLGTPFLRPEAFDVQIRRIIPLIGSEEKLWEMAKSKEVIDQICEYVRDLGTPGLGLILGACVNFALGESHEKREDYYRFLTVLMNEYAGKYPQMVSPKATFYMMIITVGAPNAWANFLKMVPSLQYISKLPDMIDSERINFDLTRSGNVEKFAKIIDDVLLPNKSIMVWNDPRVLIMILKGVGYEKFTEFNFSDEKLHDTYTMLAKISPKSPYIKLLASKNMKIRNEVFSTIQKRMSLGGLDPAKFCDANRNLADLPEAEVPQNIKDLFSKSFDALKIAQWRQDVTGTKDLFSKAKWMHDTFVDKVEERARLTTKAKAHSIASVVTMTNALDSETLDELMKEIPEEDIKEALQAHNMMDINGLAMIVENLNENHYEHLSYEAMARLLHTIEKAADTKKEKTEAERAQHEQIRLGMCDIVGKWVEHRGNDADKLFVMMRSDPTLKSFVLEYFGNFSAINSLVKLVNNSEIRPPKKIDSNTLRTILSINNIKIPTSKPVDVAALDKISKLKDILDAKNQTKLLWKDLQVTKVKKTEEELALSTIELDKHTNSKHGNVALKILEEFDVDIEVQRLGCEAWDKTHAKDEVIEPAFHGTGAVAASFILRFGFAIVQKSAGGVNVTAKMLGDGIYFSNIVDKAAQYIGDAGFGRDIGDTGFLFEMRANIGKEGKDYRSAGTGKGDNIISPEWCVFTPNSQLRIKKAYKVERITKNDMRDLKGRYQLGTKKFKAQAKDGLDGDLG